MDRDRTPLTPEEIELIRELLPVAADLKREAEYKLAVRLVARTWRTAVLWIAGLIGAIVVLREQGAKLWAWFIGG